MADLLTPQLNAETPAPDWLQARRLAGRAAWESSELPTRKTEAWKYTSLFALQQPFMAAREMQKVPKRSVLSCRSWQAADWFSLMASGAKICLRLSPMQRLNWCVFQKRTKRRLP